MDRCLQQQSPIVRVAPYRAASLNHFVDGVSRLSEHLTNDDYSYSIGRYELAQKLSDTRAALVRL